MLGKTEDIFNILRKFPYVLFQSLSICCELTIVLMTPFTSHVPELHMIGNLEHLFFHVQGLPFNTVLLRFVHVAGCVGFCSLLIAE